MRDTETTIRGLSLLEKAALLSGANTWQTRAIPRAGVPSIRMADGPHGIRRQVGSSDHLGLNASEPATCFPTAATIANSWDPDLAFEIGEALGREAAAQGVDVLLSPGLNIKRSPLGGRNFEYFSEDPELTGRLAAASVRGIQSTGVAATPKHFAVNSQELRRMVSDSVVDRRTLRELYLTAFEIVVREGDPWAIMSAYNLVNGVYAHENRALLIDILREEWGFTGAVVSDWGGSDDAVSAVRAGGTIEMPSPGFDSVRQIVAAVESGQLAEADLDARVAEVLDLARRVTARAAATAPDLDAHHALARRAAASSAVLLRNEGDLLPLAPGTRVALVGEFARSPRIQGAGSSEVNATRVSSLVGAIAQTQLEFITYAAGYRRDAVADPALVAEAVRAAADADVALIALGQPESAESEARDRSGIDLPADQIALLRAVAAANPRTVVVLTAGGVIATPWISSAAALLHGYLGGQAGADGILDVVTGAVSPAGRLAESFPFTIADTPTAGAFPSRDRAAEYREGLFVGYRYYATAGVDVAFPFGFGLSYGSFVFRDLEVDDDGAGVSLTVQNVGSRAGIAVPQLYVGRESPSVLHRPVRELKGWARVPLEPGESARVSIPFGPRTFRSFDPLAAPPCPTSCETRRDGLQELGHDRREVGHPDGGWRVEQGAYRLTVGAHADDDALSIVHQVRGDVLAAREPAPAPYRTGAVRGVSDEDFAALLGSAVTRRGPAPSHLGMNDPIGALKHGRTRTARLAHRLLAARLRAAERAGASELNRLFLFDAPFRAISKMSAGHAPREVVAALLVAVNGRPVRGLVRVVIEAVRGRRRERKTRRAFEASAGVSPARGNGRRATRAGRPVPRPVPPR